MGQTQRLHSIHHVAKNTAGTILPQDDRVFRCGNAVIDAWLAVGWPLDAQAGWNLLPCFGPESGKWQRNFGLGRAK